MDGLFWSEKYGGKWFMGFKNSLDTLKIVSREELPYFATKTRCCGMCGAVGFLWFIGRTRPGAEMRAFELW